MASYLYFYFVTSANTPLALQVTNYDPVVNANRQTDDLITKSIGSKAVQ